VAAGGVVIDAHALTHRIASRSIASHPLSQLVAEGQVRHVGLWECTPAELRRAHAAQPLRAVQLERSLQPRDAEASLVPAARALGIRRVLSRAVARRADLRPGD
jgi:aryl-alcohol dehydrogenase-like predicted oxidoreductase